MTGNIIKLIALSLLLLVFSCRNTNTRNVNLPLPADDSVSSVATDKHSEEAIADIVQNIGSPVEIAAIMQGMEVPFSAEYLASNSGSDELTTNFQKAVMLGIYGTDLVYLNLYEKTGNSVDVLSTIKKLADGLRVGQFFDFESIKRLSVSNSNLDSLLFLSVSSYNEIDRYLRNNGRVSISALMIAGTWIEGQFMATQVAADHPDSVLRNRIGEQKMVLEDLLMLLRPYRQSSPEYSSLYNMMEKISNAYSTVKISYRLAEPETVEEDGRLVMIQHEESIVKMSDEQLADITGIIKEVRNKIVSGQ